jgi:flagellar basal body-associated protein FliL
MTEMTLGWILTWILITIILAATVGIIIKRHARKKIITTAPAQTNSPASPNTSKKKTGFWPVLGGIVGTIAIIVIIVLVVIFVLSLFHGCNRKTAPENIQPAATTTVVVGKQKTSYNFGPDGTVVIYIGSEATYYPVGGAVEEITPSGKINIFRPGEKVFFPSENAGNFTFSAYDKNATGVDVWQ